MANAVIGAKGEMAKNLLLPLLAKLGPVIAVDRDSPPETWTQAWKADVIWLAIPRDEVPKVLQGVKLRGQQLIVDICSVKRRISEVVAGTGAGHLSLHPMHGPFVPLQGQRWAVMRGRDENHPLAAEILKFLNDQNINFLEPCTEDEHDFMIGVGLSIPELLTIVIDSMISRYAK